MGLHCAESGLLTFALFVPSLSRLDLLVFTRSFTYIQKNTLCPVARYVARQAENLLNEIGLGSIRLKKNLRTAVFVTSVVISIVGFGTFTVLPRRTRVKIVLDDEPDSCNETAGHSQDGVLQLPLKLALSGRYWN